VRKEREMAVHWVDWSERQSVVVWVVSKEREKGE
jgi:hypothetical protein